MEIKKSFLEINWKGSKRYIKRKWTGTKMKLERSCTGNESKIYGNFFWKVIGKALERHSKGNGKETKVSIGLTT